MSGRPGPKMACRAWSLQCERLRSRQAFDCDPETGWYHMWCLHRRPLPVVAALVSQREKLWEHMRGAGRRNVRFEELLNFAKHYGFTCTVRGADYVFRHPVLGYTVFVGRPHGGRDVLWPHDVDRFVDAVEELIEKGWITDLPLED